MKLNIFKSPDIKRPNFIQIGVQKGGTSWIHNVLNKHSMVNMSSVKEPCFFRSKNDIKNKEKIKQYLSLWDFSKDYKIYGESSIAYFHAGQPLRTKLMKKYLGNKVKYLISFRNPIDRAVSAFFMHFYKGRMNGRESIFDEQLNNKFQIIDIGKYKKHLAIWFQYYTRDFFHIVLFDELKNDSKTVINNILVFLNLTHESIISNAQLKMNVGLELKRENGVTTINQDSKYFKNRALFNPAKPESIRLKGYKVPYVDFNNIILPKVYDSEIEELMDIYKDDIKYLEELLETDLSSWFTNIEVLNI